MSFSRPYLPFVAAGLLSGVLLSFLECLPSRVWNSGKSGNENYEHDKLCVNQLLGPYNVLICG